MNTTGILRDRRLNDPDLTLTTKEMSDSFNKLDGSEGLVGTINNGIEAIVKWIKDKLGYLWGMLFATRGTNQSFVQSLRNKTNKVKIAKIGDFLSLSKSNSLSTLCPVNALSVLDEDLFKWSKSPNKPKRQIELSKLNRYLEDYIKVINVFKTKTGSETVKENMQFEASVGGSKFGVAVLNGTGKFYHRDYLVKENIGIIGDKQSFGKLIKIQENLIDYLDQQQISIKTLNKVIKDTGKDDLEQLKFLKFRLLMTEQVVKSVSMMSSEIEGVLEALTKEHKK